jgi:glyceraldehyde-3-phosphate dehydrogenase (NAD(P))
MADLAAARHLYEVALWTDMLKVAGDELFYAYMVTIRPSYSRDVDAIRALTGKERDARTSIPNRQSPRDGPHR